MNAVLQSFMAATTIVIARVLMLFDGVRQTAQVRSDRCNSQEKR